MPTMRASPGIHTYLYKLLDELSQLVNCPVECVNAQILLSREISKVWGEIQQSSGGIRGSGGQEGESTSLTRHNGDNNCTQSPIYSMLSPPADFPARFSSSFETPMKFKTNLNLDMNGNSDNEEDFQNTSRMSETPNSETCHMLQTKIYIPEAPQQMNGQPVKCNYIGRILGPSGMSAKMIEKQFNVTLLIRGRGSIRDNDKEAMLIKRKGFEHLNEPLHVLLVAKHENRQKCVDLLNRAAEKVEGLLTPIHDDLKKDQLLRLAVINGTYTQRTPRSTPEIANNSMCSF